MLLTEAVGRHVRPVAATATPVASSEILIPDPLDCRVDPVPSSFIEQFLPYVPATAEASTVTGPTTLPVSTNAVHVAVPTIGQATPGAPAVDQETVSAVAATAYEYVACLNAGDRLRMLALHTERAARSELKRTIHTAEDVRTLMAPPQPRSQVQRIGLLPVEFAYETYEGRVGATVNLVVPVPGRSRSETVMTVMYFLYEADRYRIDDLVVFGG